MTDNTIEGLGHKFQPSIGNPAKCARCQWPEIQHTSEAECEVCTNKGWVRPVFGNILMCEECIAKETQLALDNMSTVAQESRVTSMNEAVDIAHHIENKRLELARLIDDSIETRTDLFNASTVSILELCKAIDEDDTITNKPYAKAEELVRRHKHHTKVIFEQSEDNMKRTHDQKAIQIYLNEMAKSLRAEEREKLKIADITYKPTAPTVTKSPKVSTPKAVKFDKKLLAQYAKELGIAEFTIQTIAVQKNSLDEAVKFLRGIKANAQVNLVKPEESK